MKILHIDSDDINNPMGGGQAVRTFEINRRLAQRHQITVCTVNYSGARNEKIEGIKYIRLGGSNFPWNLFVFFLKIHKVIKNGNFDLIVENFTSPFGPALTPLFTNKPVIAMIDWAFAWEMTIKYKFPFFIWQNLGKKLYKNFIFPTNAMKKDLLGEKLSGYNILTLNNQPLSEFPRLSQKIRTKNFALFIGRLDIHQKGIDLLLEAFSKIPKNLKIPLYIAGEGRDKRKIERLIEKYDLKNDVKLLGKILGKEKLKYLKEAKIIVIPSRYESGCIVAIECLMLKKTIVTFDKPVLMESTQKQAVYAKSFNIDDLSLKIIYAWKNSFTISKKIHYKPFLSWDKIAKIQENFYLEVVKNHFKTIEY